jgi:hypothetical protein
MGSGAAVLTRCVLMPKVTGRAGGATLSRRGLAEAIDRGPDQQIAVPSTSVM